LVGLTVLGLVCLGSIPSARAADEPGSFEEGPSRQVVAVAAGAATSFASFAGGIIVAAEAHDRATRNAGLIGAQAGLTLSPVVAHAIMGDPARGALFALIPLAGVATTVTLASTIPDFVAHAPPPIQWTTIAALAVSVFGSTFGVLEAVSVAPVVGGSMAGAMVGGKL
jgi:hypothetical protein